MKKTYLMCAHKVGVLVVYLLLAYGIYNGDVEL